MDGDTPPIPSVSEVHRKVSEFAFGSPLVTNVLRGHVAEAIIALALEPEWRWCANDYASWDFERADGLRLEVKQSAARQSWTTAGRSSPPAFDIRERTGYWNAGQWVAEAGRPADIYVLAYHAVADATADHRDPQQWTFAVISRAELPAQKTIGLGRASQFGSCHSFDSLKQAITNLAQRL